MALNLEMPTAAAFLAHPDPLTRRVAQAYAAGAFLMDNDGEGIEFYTVTKRALIPLSESAGLHIPRRLRRELQKFEPHWNRAFEAVLQGCRGQLPGSPPRDGEWISDELCTLYQHLHRMGLSHSFEVWRDGELAGGVLGMALGGAFIAESKFHRVNNASKAALIHLTQQLNQGGFVLLDAQIQNPHLARLGSYEVSREEFQTQLERALAVDATLDDEL